ncbi:MAG: glucokinase [Vicinamibacterales bacterium]
MLLAGDVGGTKTLLGLFQRAPKRPEPVGLVAYSTRDFRSFTDMLQAFARDVRPPEPIEAAAIGVAGPVVNGRAQLTNVAFEIAVDEITAWGGRVRARLLNDLEALANSVDVLRPEEIVELQPGIARQDGNAVVIAAGTGLGEAYLHRVDGRLQPAPSEGGHADFAARTDREVDLLRFLRARFGRAEVEHVLCGPGILNLHEFTHQDKDCPTLIAAPVGGEPAAISQAAMARSCPGCVEAMDLFVSAYGAEAGNLALRGVATAGVYIGGGISPKILPLLRRGDFLDAFRSKAPMDDLVAQIPVKVILNEEAGVLGAAVCANEM